MTEKSNLLQERNYSRLVAGLLNVLPKNDPASVQVESVLFADHGDELPDFGALVTILLDRLAGKHQGNGSPSTP